MWTWAWGMITLFTHFLNITWPPLVSWNKTLVQNWGQHSSVFFSCGLWGRWQVRVCVCHSAQHPLLHESFPQHLLMLLSSMAPSVSFSVGKECLAKASLNGGECSCVSVGPRELGNRNVRVQNFTEGLCWFLYPHRARLELTSAVSRAGRLCKGSKIFWAWPPSQGRQMDCHGLEINSNKAMWALCRIYYLS